MATLRQKAVAKDISENIGKPVSKSMADNGYSLSYSEQPHKLTESKAWEELMETYLPDEKLARVHSEGLEATKTSNAAILLTTDGKTIKAEEQGLIEVPDHATRAKYLELGYKVKGKTNEKNINVQVNNYVPILGDTEVYVPKDNSS